MATFSELHNSWNQLYAKANNMRVPEREVLTSEGVYLRKRPEPEVVEHMLDDLETKMRNYFILYNREREFRKKAEENCYQLEQELVNQKQKLEEADYRFHCLERKVKSMVDQPLKLKETIDRIELLYNQMDTLIQAFVGIGSCAVIQGYSRVAFIKLCLEYLYPCRDLDIRLNTLYTALYGVLTQYDGIELTMNEVMKPLTHEPSEKANLTGLSLKVHRLMLKCDLPNSDTKTFGCFFRYDNEPKELKDTEVSRFLTLNVNPMDNASKVYEFNSVVENPNLPPKVPNVVPKLVLDVYAENLFVGSASVSLISDKTLKPSEPWNVLDTNGVHCGDVVVTVLPVPKNAKLPAVNFTSKMDELLKVDGATSKEPSAETVQNLQKMPTQPVSKEVEPPKPKAEKKDLEPVVNPNVRKPLFNPKSAAVKPTTGPRLTQGNLKAQQDSQKTKAQASKSPNSNVSRLSLLFAGKKQSVEKEPEEVKDESAADQTREKEVENKKEKERSSIKDLIIKKLSTRVALKEDSKENEEPKKESEPVPVVEKQESKSVTKEETANPELQTKLKSRESIIEALSKMGSTSSVKKEDKPVEEKVEKQQSKKVETQPAEAPQNTQETKVEKKPTKEPLPPPVPPKVVPKLPVKEPVPEPPKKPAESLPEKPLVPIVIAPKLLKKPMMPKKL